MQPPPSDVLAARALPDLLTEREAWLLAFVFDDDGQRIPLRLSQAAEELGVGRERVRQLIHGGIDRVLVRGEGPSNRMMAQHDGRLPEHLRPT